MTPAEKGRFCASCQKPVIDFSAMSDSQLAAFFKKPLYESVCGRFFHDQLNRDIEIPKKRMPWIKYFFQFVLPAFLMSARATAQGKVKISKNDTILMKERVLISHTTPSMMPLTEIADPVTTGLIYAPITGPVETSVKPLPDLTLPVRSAPAFVKSTPQLLVSRDITGKVINEKGEAVPFASIILKGTRRGAVTDSNGHFTISPGNEWNTVSIVVSCVGFEITELQVTSQTPFVNVVLPAYSGQLMGVIVCIKPTSKKKSKPLPLLTQKLMDTAYKFFKVFPNPVSPGASLHIEWKEKEEGYYLFELINLSGKKVYAKEIWVDAEARLLNLEIPSVVAGNYFLRATSKESGKNFTEKIVVE